VKNAVFRDITQCGSCKNRVSEERIASIITAIRIADNGGDPPNRQILQDPHSVTFQTTTFVNVRLSFDIFKLSANEKISNFICIFPWQQTIALNEMFPKFDEWRLLGCYAVLLW
jgi:hypothetical protein